MMEHISAPLTRVLEQTAKAFKASWEETDRMISAAVEREKLRAKAK